jgi:hypothetical protein
MYGPGRALQDRSSKTDERESCNNVSYQRPETVTH